MSCVKMTLTQRQPMLYFSLDDFPYEYISKTALVLVS